MFRLRLGAVIVAIAVCAIGTRPGGAQSKPYPRVPKFHETYDWARIVGAHEMGRIDSALRALAKWPAERLERVRFDLELVRRVIVAAMEDRNSATQNGMQRILSQTSGLRGGVYLPTSTLSVFELEALLDLPRGVRRVTDGPRESIRPDGPMRRAIAVFMTKAAMLHSDLMLISAADFRAAKIETSRASQQAFRVVDGQGFDEVSGSQHWAIARAAMDFLVPVPRGQPVVSQWYDATATYLLGKRDYDSGRQHLEHAAARYMADARIAFLLGVVYENLAAPRIQALTDGDRSGLRLETRDVLLALAEKRIRVAIDLDPRLPEAGLRLARILEMTGRADEAVKILQQVRPSLRGEYAYYAELFLGRAFQSMGQDDEARAAFGRARDLYPRAQSPLLALGQLEWNTDQPGAATSSVERLQALNRETDPKGVADPWWLYDVSPALDVQKRADAMRRAIEEFLK